MLMDVFAFPEFIQFLDDDIVSLIGITALVNPSYREDRLPAILSQQSLSLYLIAQCQMKLCHSLKALAKTIDDIIEVERFIKLNTPWLTLVYLLMKLLKRKIRIYIRQRT